MKQVGIKLESKHYHRYYYYYSAYRVEEVLYTMCRDLKEGQSIVVKCGRHHYYIEYDSYDEHDDTAFMHDINRIMYYVREYLG